MLISRCGGLVRDSLLASFLGAGWIFDAYTTALRIPNMLRDLLGEGALSSVVVARLGVLAKDRERSKHFVRQLMGFWMIGLGLVALAGIFAAPLLVRVIAHGFTRPDQIELAVHLTRIIFPYVAIVGMAAMSMGVLHHLKVFGWASSASTFANISMILSLLVCGFFIKDDMDTLATWIAIAVVFSGLVQWAALWPGFKGSGYSLIPVFRFSDPEIFKVVRLLGPSVLSVAAVQINVAVNHGFATSIGEGSASSIYYAFRIMMLPVGIVGVAVSTVLLPTLTDCVREERSKDFCGELGQALVGASFLTIPAIGGLCVLGPDLIALLYQHGQFNAQNTAMVWMALQGFICGILPYVFNKSLVQAFFAHSDTRFPLRISALSIVINASVNAYMVYGCHMGIRGLTLGTSGVLFCNAGLLIVGLSYKYGYKLPWKAMLKSLSAMVGLTLLMILVLNLVGHYMAGNLAVIVKTAVGGGCYLGGWMVLYKGFGWDFRKVGLSS